MELPGGPVANWWLDLKTNRAETQRRKPHFEEASMWSLHEPKPAASLEVLPPGGEKGEPSSGIRGEGYRSREDPGDAAAKSSSVCREWNVQKVATGTGKAPSGSVACEQMSPEHDAQ